MLCLVGCTIQQCLCSWQVKSVTCHNSLDFFCLCINDEINLRVSYAIFYLSIYCWKVQLQQWLPLYVMELNSIQKLQSWISTPIWLHFCDFQCTLTHNNINILHHVVQNSYILILKTFHWYSSAIVLQCTDFLLL